MIMLMDAKRCAAHLKPAPLHADILLIRSGPALCDLLVWQQWAQQVTNSLNSGWLSPFGVLCAFDVPILA